MKCLSHLRAFADASPSTKGILFLSPQHLLTTQLTPTWGCLNEWFISLPDLLIGLGIPLSADIARSPPLYTVINCSLVFSSTRSGGLCGKGLSTFCSKWHHAQQAGWIERSIDICSSYRCLLTCHSTDCSTMALSYLSLVSMEVLHLFLKKILKISRCCAHLLDDHNETTTKLQNHH